MESIENLHAPNILQPVITTVGINALIDAKKAGLQARIITVEVGDGGKDATPDEQRKATKLGNCCASTSVCAGGELTGSKQNQLHLTGRITGNETYTINEIGFFLDKKDNNGNPILFAIYEREATITEKVAYTDFLLSFDLTLSGVAAGDVAIDGSGQFDANLARDNLLVGQQVAKIHTQEEFDVLFNQGDNTVITANTTIVLSPIQACETGNLAKGAWGGTGDNPENTFNGRPAYILKNAVTLNSNVIIIGFNQEDTVIVKDINATNAKQIAFNVVKSNEDGKMVSGIRLAGWSFDGRGGVNSLGGKLQSTVAAFNLDYCQHSQFNCKIINHYNTGNGGAIYGNKTSNDITAEFIYDNYAKSGAGIYGCNNVALTITNTDHAIAECQGGVARLVNSQVADISGGVTLLSPEINSIGLVGSLGIGTLPSSALDVVGSAKISDTLTAPKIGIGKSPDLPLDVTGDASINGKLTAQQIGSGSPNLPLDVTGDASISGTLKVSNSLTLKTGPAVNTISIDHNFQNASDAMLPTALAVKQNLDKLLYIDMFEIVWQGGEKEGDENRYATAVSLSNNTAFVGRLLEPKYISKGEAPEDANSYVKYISKK